MGQAGASGDGVPSFADTATLRWMGDISPYAVLLVDGDGAIRQANAKAGTLFGYGAEEMVGLSIETLVPEGDRQRHGELRETYLAAPRERPMGAGRELQALHRSGEVIPVEIALVPVDVAGTRMVMVSAIDLSVRKALEAQLHHQANHDPLTGLVNRYHFEELLAREIERGQRYGGGFALIMLDIDHFKAVNDTYGHLEGDKVLRRFAEELTGKIRAADTLARWGGEEFMLLLPGTDIAGARALAEAIRVAVNGCRMPVPGQVTVSLGVTGYRNGESVWGLLKRVDEALYAAKLAGRDQVVVL
ncbi:diguanylate cyclase with PAS/PAC sensor [Alkalilimnicola ehrlichii MLHE-1]|uniref:diguanylate cyclase n=1 Tax=Alkalilimnicola ehrlichii (strain ATCC BAA-1101 / DSM 17681 / MLHE-1) TaxID=187272 RepID=Q0A8W9_ALKEH|nr:diguanylate cyclase with PAS/PAC sensor [Alkalilimnicola ehrlichii MLHE-1]